MTQRNVVIMVVGTYSMYDLPTQRRHVLYGPAIFMGGEAVLAAKC